MRKARSEVMVGTFVIFGFILLSMIVLFVSGANLVRTGYRIGVVFHYVSILDKGAPVRMAGVRIGEVTQVSFREDKETGQTTVLVQVFIAKRFKIRQNYEFAVRGTHILSEPHIEISPQPGREPFFREGAVTQGKDPVPVEVLVDRADQIAAHLEALLGRLRTALENKETETSVRETIVNLAAITRSLNQILSGSENDMVESLKHLNASTQALESVLTRIDKGEGTLGKLTKEEELYQEVRDFVQDIKTHPWKLLRSGSGEKKGVKWVPFI